MQGSFNPQKIKIIIGLGNPGEKYENTYHNVGFLFLDYLTKNLQISNFSARSGSASGGQFLISKSDVYMNESGRFVYKTLKDKKIKPDALLIVHDDSDIAFQNYKFSFGRNSAGHKGIESIIKTLKTNRFWRLRIGVRKKNEKVRQKAESFVLKNIASQDKKMLENVFKKITNAIFTGTAYRNGN